MKRRTLPLCRALVTLCATVLCLGSLPVIPFSARAEEAYTAPDYVVDFSDPDAIDSCYDVFHCEAVPEDGAMKITFTDTGGGTCFDPYLSLSLDNNRFSCETYPYLSLLVKTNKHDLKGQLRLRTTSTGNEYPCQEFTYQSTEEWQVVVINLTNRSTLLFYPATAPLNGNYTNLRLDMFNNECPADTEYAVKAYALCKTAEEAAAFINYRTKAEVGEDTPDIPPVDYASFWMGTAFKDPATAKKMSWVSAGYSNNNATTDKLFRQGYGGLTSNVLYNQNYLRDDEQFSILKDTLAYADSLGMSTWIYDEYQWPSGKAFGLVLEGHDEFEATGIEHKEISGRDGTATYTVSGKEIRIMEAVLDDDDGTRSLELADDGRVSVSPKGKYTLHVYVLRYTFEEEEDPTNWEKLRDVDLLNPAAVARFIEVTHAQYKSKLGDVFDRLEGFFTDEPQLGNRAEESYVVWTADLDKKFFETYGYELSIPSLFSGTSDYDKIIRMNYYQLVSSLFKTAYIDQISAWCEANGVASSGHLLFEEDMNDHVETYGGDFLQFVGGMTIPGADILWVNPERLMSKGNIGNYMGLRYVASAAKNAGKKDVLLEYNPDAAGALPDEPMAASLGGASIARLLGCNVFHVINPQYNYTAAQLRELNTYVGRMNTILDEVNECGDVAVFYPIATIQALHAADSDHSSTTGGERQTAAYKINDEYERLCKTLLTHQYMYTVLDDESIRAATVTADGRLVTGLGSYRVVILSSARYISVEALETLTRFCEAGGTVIFVGNTPEFGLRLEQEASIAALMARLSDQPALSLGSGKELISLLDGLTHRDLTVSVISGESQNLLMGDFESEDRDVTFLVNASYADTTVTLRYTDGYTGEATLYHPATGYIATVTLGEGTELTIPACVGVILMREADNTRDDTAYVPAETQPETETPPAGTTSGPETESHTAPTDGGCRSVMSPVAALVSVVAALACAAASKKRED